MPEKEPGVHHRMGTVPPTRPICGMCWHPLPPWLGFSVGPRAEGAVQPVQLSRITREPCAQPGIAEVAAPSSTHTHAHTPQP